MIFTKLKFHKLLGNKHHDFSHSVVSVSDYILYIARV